MQSNSFIVLILLTVMKSLHSAPTDNLNNGLDLEEAPETGTSSNNQIIEKSKADYYEYRHVVADGVQKALDECREKFKWDRWNCPKKAFLDILDRSPLPANKELGLTRALIASGIVLSVTRSCSYGTRNVCGCDPTNEQIFHELNVNGYIKHPHLNPIAHGKEKSLPSSKALTSGFGKFDNQTVISSKFSKFIWKGCDESVKFAFKVSEMYLESQDVQQDAASRKINAHNYEVGRLAVKKNMKQICKCHGVSGSCQVNTCWNTVPHMTDVGNYLKKQYRMAAKVGAMTAEETNIESLDKELKAIASDKLVFSDPSPDYCYEIPKLGINGTLGRYCNKAKHRSDGTPISRNERESCDKLCTKCGYKIKKERLHTEKQCDCRFVYCCSVECQRCPHVEDTYRCVRHS